MIDRYSTVEYQLSRLSSGKIRCDETKRGSPSTGSEASPNASAYCGLVWSPVRDEFCRLDHMNGCDQDDGADVNPDHCSAAQELCYFWQAQKPRRRAVCSHRIEDRQRTEDGC